MSYLVSVDDVLNLFDCSDSDIYAKEVITDALHDGTLKIFDIQDNIFINKN